MVLLAQKYPQVLRQSETLDLSVLLQTKLEDVQRQVRSPKGREADEGVGRGCSHAGRAKPSGARSFQALSPKPHSPSLPDSKATSLNEERQQLQAGSDQGLGEDGFLKNGSVWRRSCHTGFFRLGGHLIGIAQVLQTDAFLTAF